MLKPVAAALCASLLSMTLAGPALAHHGLAKEFLMDKQVVLHGTISRVDWVNPHIYYTLDVKQPSGAMRQYHIESVPVAFARKAGVTKEKLMGGGQPVDVTIMPGRVDPDLGFGVYLKYADGFIITFEGFKE